MLHVRRPGVLVAALLTTTLTAAACGGGGDGGGDVASLSGDDSAGDGTTATTLSDDELEAALLDWTECMRGEGFDLPDPTVDEDGDLTLGRGPGGPPPGDDPGSGSGSGGEGERPDREAVEAAEEVCGQAPPGAFGGGGEVDQEAMQESALAFSECMREQGVDDFPDPDFSDMGPGAGPPPDDGSAEGGGGGGGPFGDVDMDDPEVRSAMEVCQGELGDLRGGPGGGGGGGGEASDG